MSAASRRKGSGGEREIARLLNSLIEEVLLERGIAVGDTPIVQRNQNQSAVGGKDLIGTYGMAIEVKRQETLSVNTWWKQTVEQAARLGELPVLIYRQNRKSWQVRTYVWSALPEGSGSAIVATMDLDSFKSWFKEWVNASL